MSSSHVQDLAKRLQASIQRTFRGAKPRHLRQRIHQLLRATNQTVMVLEPREKLDGDGTKHQTVVPTRLRATRLAVAGDAWERAHRFTELAAARAAHGIKDRGTVTGRHQILAKVLCWVVLILGCLTQAACLDNLTTDVDTAEGPCETFPSVIDGGTPTVTVCAIKDPR